MYLRKGVTYFLSVQRLDNLFTLPPTMDLSTFLNHVRVVLLLGMDG